MLGMFMAALDQTIVATSIRTIGDDLQRPVAAGVGHHRVPADGDDLDAAVRQALRHLRPQAAVHDRDLALRASARCCPARPTRCTSSRSTAALQGLGAGGLMALAITILGDLVAPRERARYQGVLPRGVRRLVACSVRWSAGSSPGPSTILGHRRLALGVPHQRADRHHRAHRHLAGAAPAAAPAASSTASTGPAPLAAHRRAGARCCSSPSRAAIWGWDSAQADHLLRRSACSASSAFILAERFAKADAILPLYLFRNRTFSIGRGREHRHRPGHVRRPGDAAALPADRQGADADRRPA